MGLTSRFGLSHPALRIAFAVILSGLLAYGVTHLLVESITLNGYYTKSFYSLVGRAKGAPIYKPLRIVRVDRATKEAAGVTNFTGSFPRRHYAEFIQRLDAAGANTVLFDIDFSRPDPEDELLGQAITESQNLNVVTLAYSPSTNSPEAEESLLFDFEPPPTGPLEGIERGHGIAFVPLDAASGYFPVVGDAADDSDVISMVLLSAIHARRLNPDDLVIDWDRIAVGDFEWNLDSNGDVLIRWPDARDAIPEQDFDAAMAELQTDPSAWRDAVVVIGDFTIESDKVVVPRLGMTQGTRVVAMMLNGTMASPSERIHSLPERSILAYMTAFGALAIAAWMFLRPLAAGLINLGLIGLSIGLPLMVVRNQPLVLPQLEAAFHLGLITLIGALWFAARSRPMAWRQAGEIREATFMFGDLRDSTPLVQQLGARRYQEVYAELIRRAEAILRQHGASIERTTGDGFIATFESRTGGSVKAIRAAQTIRAILPELSQEFDLPLDFTLGLETGPASGGYVSEAGIRTWSSSGATVNMAQRLQSLAGSQPGGIVIGPVARGLAREEVQLESLSPQTLKGFDEPVEAFVLTDHDR